MPGLSLSPRDVMEAEDRAEYYLRKLVWRILSAGGHRSTAAGSSGRERLLFYSKSPEAAGTLSAITRRHSSISMWLAR